MSKTNVMRNTCKFYKVVILSYVKSSSYFTIIRKHIFYLSSFKEVNYLNILQMQHASKKVGGSFMLVK